MIDTIIATGLVPGPLLRMGIRSLLKSRLNDESKAFDMASFCDFINQSRTIAISTDESKEQHYEVPTSFYKTVLGPRLKYSSGYWPTETDDLETSERRILDLYCERAKISDGQSILDLGCGWGSLSLYLAEKYPNSQVTGLSHSRTQRQYILDTAKQKKLRNLRIITEDINTAEIPDRYDRILSIEMFEHMRNYNALFRKVSKALSDNGLLFIHVFGHKKLAYTFDSEGSSNWMGRYFFKDGIMPSRDLFSYAQDSFSVRECWEMNGQHYQKTLEAWLEKMRQNKTELYPIFQSHYGKEAKKFWHYWEVFFMACSELFGFKEGSEWQVYHYLMEKARV